MWLNLTWKTKHFHYNLNVICINDSVDFFRDYMRQNERIEVFKSIIIRSKLTNLRHKTF